MEGRWSSHGVGRLGELRAGSGAPGEEGRPRDQPLAAEGLTACQDGEGWGVWGERAGVWVERSAQTQPPKSGPRNAGRGETTPSADWSCPGLARAGHSPTAQWLPRGYILASTVSPAARTGAAGARGAWQRTSASRTSGSSRPRMVPTGGSGARRERGGGCAFLAEERPQDVDLGELRCRRLRRCCSLRQAPTLYGSPAGGGAGGGLGAPPPRTGAL